MAKIGYFNAVLSDKGIPIQATITVYLAGTSTKATIYSNAAGTIVKDNPFQTDVLGRFEFFAADGNYDVEVSGSGITTYKIENQPLGIPDSEVVVGDWTPSPTNLTVVGTPTYAGKYVKIGHVVFCTLQVQSTTSTAATAGSTTFTGLPYTPAHNSVCTAVNKVSVASYGNGLVYTSGAVWVPTWPAVAWVTVSFFYFV